MTDSLNYIIDKLFCRNPGYLYQANATFREAGIPATEKIAAAFLIQLAGPENLLHQEATDFLNTYENTKEQGLKDFYRARTADIANELERAYNEDRELRLAVNELAAAIENGESLEALQNHIWKVFFPEGVGVFSNKQQIAEMLRDMRKVEITGANRSPIAQPGKEMLFTSNALLTIPSEHTDIEALPYPQELRRRIKAAASEPQKYWYDHPIQIGVAPEENEILYGLEGLDKALETERQRGNLNGRVKCLLSVSVTHEGLFDIARDYISQELSMHTSLQNLDVYIFTEEDTRKILEEVMLPLARRYFDKPQSERLHSIFGVNGAYGRHYSFLKAIAAVWNIFIDPQVKATFKIDLDQVFPQKELIEQTGASALELFKTPLWGAYGRDRDGNPVELGMIAGALVNQKDIDKGLRTPDVPFPDKIPDIESRVFFSKMLMALSTEGEMMTRYNGTDNLDGNNTCIQRIHVTGGTNGIRVDALRKHRPFTPTFIGRAEDQAYILSVLGQNHKPRLAYLHQDGLIMRHDKEAFAQQAMENAKLGKIAGDYIRLLYFSAYAKTLSSDVSHIKKIANPFTGSFISKIPVTVTILRFVLKSIDLRRQQEAQARKFVLQNCQRLADAIAYVQGNNGSLEKQVQDEQRGWHQFYDILDRSETALQNNAPEAQEAAENMQRLLNNCKVSG